MPRRRKLCHWFVAAAVVAVWLAVASDLNAAPPRRLSDLELQEGYVEAADGVKIHYVTTGQGPLMVLIHGFADFWYTWRGQMPEWSRYYRVVAIDLRGYNRSGKPEGIESYSIDHLMGDIDATLAHFQSSRAVIVGHDWGGFLAWEYAMRNPGKVDRLVVLNSPHPQAVLRELATQVDPQKLQEKRESLTSDEALLRWTPARLASWVRDPVARQHYIEAFQRSSVEAILNHYKAHYSDPNRTVRYRRREQATVRCPVLMLHGMRDTRVPASALHDNWQWVQSDLTVVMLRKAGHFIHHDQAATVTQRVLQWLDPAPVESITPIPPAVERPSERTTNRPAPFDPRRR